MLKRVSINKDLLNVLRLLKFLFNFIWCNILTLREFEYVLLSINNFERSIWQEHADVTSMAPPLRIKTVTSLFGLTEIALKDVVSRVADFPSRHGNTVLILIFTGVIHIWNINKLDVEGWVGTTDVPG
jgi:hypothetical protein